MGDTPCFAFRLLFGEAAAGQEERRERFPRSRPGYRRCGAIAIENSIDDLSQPPYSPIPANELCGEFLLDINCPAEASTYFLKALQRTQTVPGSSLGSLVLRKLWVILRQQESVTMNSWGFGELLIQTVRNSQRRWNFIRCIIRRVGGNPYLWV